MRPAKSHTVYINRIHEILHAVRFEETKYFELCADDEELKNYFCEGLINKFSIFKSDVKTAIW